MSTVPPERQTSERFAIGIAIRREVADSVQIAQALFKEIDGESDGRNER